MAADDQPGAPLTFVLGAATDPTGTEWLHRSLAATPSFVPGHSEAYHVLDAVDLGLDTEPTRRLADLAASALADLRAGRPADAAVLHRMSMIGNLTLYYDYFAALLHQDPQRTLTADATADYAHLSVERLTEVRREFEARGVRVVPIFITGDQPQTNDAWDAAFGGTVQYALSGTAIEIPTQNV